MAPDQQAQEEARRTRAAKALKAASQRRHAGLVLVGYVVGAAVGLYGFDRIGFAGLIGASAGFVLSLLIERLGKRAAA